MPKYDMLRRQQNLLVALDIMQLLVEIETLCRGLNRTMETARIFEESMQDRIVFLEAQLDKARENSSCIAKLLSSDCCNLNYFLPAPRISKVCITSYYILPVIHEH